VSLARVPVYLSQIPNAAPPGQASGSGTWATVGTGTGQRAPKASGSGTTAYVGAGTGKRAPKASGSGSVAYVGTGAGKRTPKASGAGIYTFAGAGLAVTARRATGSGALDWIGTGSGHRDPLAAGTGLWTYDGTGTGSTPAEPPPGEATGGGMFTYEGDGLALRPAIASGGGEFIYEGAAVLAPEAPSAPLEGEPMALGTFALLIDGARLDGTPETTAVVSIASDQAALEDEVADRYFFPSATAETGKRVTLPYTVTLRTDVPEGGTDPSAIGYTVTVSTRYGGRVTSHIAAQPASTTPVALTDLPELV
jgi:hypothetical protein